MLPGLTVAGIVTNVTEALQISKSFSGENIYIEKYIKNCFAHLASVLYLERDFVANWIKRRNQFLTAVDLDLEAEVCLSGKKPH